LEDSLVRRNRAVKGLGGAGGDGFIPGNPGDDGGALAGGAFVDPWATLVTNRTRFIDNTPAA
jgi:hypothetical protein